MEYGLKVLLIGMGIFMIFVTLYYYLYYFLINRESKKYRIPDVKTFSYLLIVSLLILSGLLISFHYQNEREQTLLNEQYEITAMVNLDEQSIDQMITTLKEELNPDNGIIYASTRNQIFELNKDLTIRKIYLQFHIYRNGSPRYYKIELLQGVTRKQNMIVDKWYRPTNDIMEGEITLEEQLSLLKEINYDHLLETIELTQYNDFMLIDLYFENENDQLYEIYNPSYHFVIKDDTIRNVLTDEELRKEDYGYISINRLTKNNNGGFTSTGDFIIYLVSK